MKCVVYRGKGGPEIVAVEERPDPVPGRFEVLLAVEYSGMNPADNLQRIGGHMPPPGSPTDVPGLETAGTILALVSNLMNNLPAGLVASTAVAQAHPPRVMVDALLIGVDLGPNLSITGSLATILWLQAIRREGENVGFWRFLKVGVVTMAPALAASLAARLLVG